MVLIAMHSWRILESGEPVASITIRNLDDAVTRRLRMRAAEHGHSMAEEARQILNAALVDLSPQPAALASAIHARFARLSGVDIDTLPRGPLREPPRFD